MTLELRERWLATPEQRPKDIIITVDIFNFEIRQ